MAAYWSSGIMGEPISASSAASIPPVSAYCSPARCTTCGANGDDFHGSQTSLIHGDLTYSCRITAEEHDSTGTGYTGKLSDMWLNGRANYQYSFRNVYVKGENATTGTVTAIGHADSTGKTYPSLVVDALGRAGQPGRLGLGHAVRLGNGTRLVYTGAGEETDRTIFLRNGGVSGTGVIEHVGTGTFEWSGVVSQECEVATIALGGSSAAGGVFSGVIGEFPRGTFANPVLNLLRGCGKKRIKIKVNRRRMGLRTQRSVAFKVRKGRQENGTDIHQQDRSTHSRYRSGRSWMQCDQ